MSLRYLGGFAAAVIFFAGGTQLAAAQSSSHRPLDLAAVKPESMGFSSERLERLHSLIQDEVDQKLLAGAVTILARHGKIVDYRTYGVRDFASGAPMTKDTIESRYERPVDVIFNSAKDVLKLNGTLTSENTINHSLIAKVDTRTVWVAVDEIEPKVSRVRVQVRTKAGRGDVDMASEIDKQIYGKLITR